MTTPRLQQLLTFLKESPNDAFLLFAIAKEYEGAGALKEALAQYKKLEVIAPNYVGTYYHLGKLHEHLEQYKEAFLSYQRGMEIAKKAGDQHALSELASAKLELGDDDDF